MPMPEWKKRIFLRVISRKIQEEGRTIDDVLSEYQALTEEEKQELREALSQT
ncbi:hypothetical protein [Candidatus Caldatribacterium sp.]|uniref:hypothetical protein n=1 Tax=Candidatus Caldatribacterium sp. TaxID=2282143 RepID=UPI00383CFF91|nr:hypothetical protein [Candidatus Caldatribacterium sp.]